MAGVSLVKLTPKPQGPNFFKLPARAVASALAHCPAFAAHPVGREPSKVSFRWQGA